MLPESVKLIEHFKETIDKANGPVAKQITKKLSETLTKNEGFTKLTQIAEALYGEFSDDLNNVDHTIFSSLKYAPITSVDVERSFSSYKIY